MKKLLLAALILLIIGVIWIKYTGSGMSDNKPNSDAWITKSPIEYQGLYRFGDSETESDLKITGKNDKIYVQIKMGNWTADGKDWVYSYEDLKNVSIKDNKFYSDKTNGEFVVTNDNGEKKYGLKVYKPWSDLTADGEYEIGYKIE